MNKIKKIRQPLLALLLLAALATLAGCGKSEQASLYDGDVAAYSHPDTGASFMVPQSWQKLAEGAQSVVFANEDKSLSLTAYLELGGYSYYSDAELQEIGQNICGQVLAEPEVLRAGARFDMGGQLVTAAGALAADAGPEPAQAVCEVLVLSPMPAVRYYLVAVGSVEAYEANSRLLEEVYLSFYTNKSEDELYAGLADYDPAGTDDDAEAAE